MEKYITIENHLFKIFIPTSLKDYGNEIIQYSTNKFNEFLHFFKEESYGTKIKCSFFLTSEDFF